MSERGVAQVDTMVKELANIPLDCVYCGPCQAAIQTAQLLAATKDAKVKPMDRLCNLDVGLWQGKRIEDIKYGQPKVYRRWQGKPETVCPPEGEMLSTAQRRIRDAIARIAKRYRNASIAIVVQEPLASVLQSELTETPLVDLWQAECNGRWEIVNVPQEYMVAN
jgi:broad specificity phosphatase PhoE